MAKIVSDFCMGEETYTLTYECVSLCSLLYYIDFNGTLFYSSGGRQNNLVD